MTQTALTFAVNASAKAHREIKADGTLGRLQAAVLNLLRAATEPMTANEITAALKSATEVNVSYHKRLSELERGGFIARCPVRECRVTGRTANTWSAIK